ncbi:uroporphyrinogen-III decarboxylase-like protein [Candidatus Desantisbacteria bacterium CG_4_10_14_0_8_um_filter_48_22]|uniref:Uroporphyrinogen-III decarboxylase-like protein n=1 Tax=Candidatus Desantisbacteria bacterium CG_4_10_14_0_8_um_filter_48_22 TaxID=1974543 RepID=A0A2M7S5F2_9BACT|nr:MAG: uroporphyrinogen-III decarboxylase-like protein [Candidatus Desantisbacteria bacterium CG_4_10_14_0_8_um_filter_48_22]PJB28835.1 MAG: uroporphyrinogen-III decarboxylase-like protein [Candidatus Desantisbacteria bacterium CG_4_9_14_3_um_filter_50_7]
MNQPNFERMRKVLLRQGEPDWVPFYEHFCDVEIYEAVTGIKMSKIDTSTVPGKKEYYTALVKFYADTGYDYVPLEIGLNFPRDNVLAADDTAQMPHGKRGWADENSGPIKNRQDFERYPWPAIEKCTDFSHFEILAEVLPEGMKVIGGISGGILEQVSGLMGFVPLSMALHDDPKLVEDMFNKTGAYRIYADEIISKIPVMGAMRMGDDMGYKTSTMFAPDFFRKYVFPWQKKAVEVAHKNKLPFVLHSCGNLAGIMDDLIDDVKIDAKHSWEDIILPVTEAKKIYGKRIAILGGVDVDFLARHSEDEVRKYTRNVLEKCAPGGGYALGSGNTVTNYVPVKNYLAMLDEGRKFSGQ